MLRDTPIEEHEGRWVKREDLIADPPAPGIFKLRGMVRFVEESYAEIFGVVDGPYSRNGWALAYVCREMGQSAVVFWPRKKADSDKPVKDVEGPSRNRARELGARIIPLQAGRSNVMNAQARKILAADYGDKAVMLPAATKLEQTVFETAEQFTKTVDRAFSYIVAPTGTGTMAAGILKGMREHPYKNGFNSARLLVYVGYPTNHERLLKYIEKASGYTTERVEIIDEGWGYNTEAQSAPPFPACLHYEAKAWDWLQRRSKISHTQYQVLFWNGGNGSYGASL